MRIALYHNVTSGGCKREAYEFARVFSEAGFDVDVYAPSSADEVFLPLKNFVQKYYEYSFKLIPGIQRSLPGLSKYVDLVALFINLQRLNALSKKIAKDIDARGYHFVFVHHDRPIQSPYLLKYLKTPSVYYCAEPMREFYEPVIYRSSWIESLQRKWYFPAEVVRRLVLKTQDKKNIRYATVLLTNSFYTNESIYRAHGLRAYVVYLGVDPKKFKKIETKKENMVLSVGAISERKGYDFLVEALSHIPADCRPNLFIVGNAAIPQEKQFIEKKALKHGVDVRFFINLSEDDLIHLYNQARVFVYASVMEPFGLGPIEAMACGTPVVAVKEGGPRESVIDGVTGLLTERNPKSFSNAIRRILDNPKFASELGDQARDGIEKYWNWDKALERLIEALKMAEVIEENDRGAY